MSLTLLVKLVNLLNEISSTCSCLVSFHANEGHYTVARRCGFYLPECLTSEIMFLPRQNKVFIEKATVFFLKYVFTRKTTGGVVSVCHSCKWLINSMNSLRPGKIVPSIEH